MSDRVVFTLACVPMISGALLLVALQRVPAVRVSASAEHAGAALSTGTTADSAWLGVVTPRHTAELASELGGKVTEVWIKAGSRVRKGDAIVQIDSREALSAEAIAGAELGQRRSEVARAEARWEEARAQLARLEQGGSWIAARELDAARAAERVAKAELSAAQAGVGMGRARFAQQRLRAQRHKLEAPFDGVLVSCDVDPGDAVGPGQIVARVISDDRQVRFALPREQLPSSGALEVSIALPAGELRAQVESVQPEVDPAAQLVFAAAPLAADTNLLPGTRVQVRPSSVLPAAEDR